MTNINGQECWYMSYDNYCAATVNSLEYVLERRCLKFPPEFVTPIKCDCCTDVDVNG